MQSADHRGVVIMHWMSVREYGHWLINNASGTNTACLYLSKIPNWLLSSSENKYWLYEHHQHQLLSPMMLHYHSTDWMVCATLFNLVDVSVACTSTPRLSVNQATACCCAVLIIAHSTVYELHSGPSLDTVWFVQALQWGRYNVRTRHLDQAGIDLKKNNISISNVCFNAIKGSRWNHLKARHLVQHSWSWFDLKLILILLACDVITWPNAEVKAVHRGWSMMWIRM